MEFNEKKVVTSLEELKGYTEGEIVELPPFSENQPFVARLRRPSILSLAQQGKIPNDLLKSANSLFEKGGNSFNSSDDEIMSKLFGVMEIICEASFIEPTYEEIRNTGLRLTDEQMMFVFGYSQKGVAQLKPFRGKRTSS